MKQLKKRSLALLLTLQAIIFLLPQIAHSQSQSEPITNFNEKGEQVTKFTTLGDAIDAHDGEIAYFDGTYYLYGTSYGCGFEWGNKKAPFCGFKTYSSADLVNWTDKGFLFDARTAIWQTRCNGSTYGCFRPHVIYNKKTALYVLWINVYDNRVGYRVFTSKSPIGPFAEREEPGLAVNSDSAMAGLNNGDHDTFVDDDGTAYLAYTDWRTKGSLVIEQLSSDYLTGTGKVVKAVTPGKTEAPALFRRKDVYYLVYSDPNCGYCSGTGVSYRTAPSPLGPWSEGIKISDNACGGQPSFVSTIKTGSGEIFLFGSDLWNHAAKNEALANYYWAPLVFAADGSIAPMNCQNKVSLPVNPAETQKPADSRRERDNFTSRCDISQNVERFQTFTAAKTGLLTSLSFTSFKSGYPDADLTIELFEVEGRQLSGNALSSLSVPEKTFSWSPENITVHPGVRLTSGKQYAIVVKSAASKGCYGLEYKESPAGATDKGKESAFRYRTTIK